MKKIQEHLGLVFLIIIAIFAVAIGGYFTLRKGVFIGDDFYYKVRADKFVHNTVNYVERTKDDTFLLVADGKKQNVSYTMKGDQVTFSFADDTINGTKRSIFLTGNAMRSVLYWKKIKMCKTV